MTTVQVRRQGGAAIMTIPAHVLRSLHIDIGTILAIEVDETGFNVRPAAPSGPRKRYSLAELLRGVTPELCEELKRETAWAREGKPMGRELS